MFRPAHCSLFLFSEKRKKKSHSSFFPHPLQRCYTVEASKATLCGSFINFLGYHHKVSHTDLEQLKCVHSQSYRPEVQNQGINRAVLSQRLSGGSLLASYSFRQWPTALDTPWLVATSLSFLPPSSQGIFLSVSLCVFTQSSFKDTCHQI